MLTHEELDRIHIVLVRARNPNNIGAAARAMHDFGLRHLRVVNDYPVPFESARSAVDASQVLANAVACSCLAEAIAGCTLVVGTTAVGERVLQQPLFPLPQAAPVSSPNCAATQAPIAPQAASPCSSAPRRPASAMTS